MVSPDAVLDHVFKNTAMPQPANLYVAMYTSSPNDDNSGTEVSGGGYTRVQCNDWTRSGSIAYNTSALTFPTPTAYWGPITHFAVFDSLAGGNLMFWGRLAQPQVIGLGSPAPTINANALTIVIN